MDGVDNGKKILLDIMARRNLMDMPDGKMVAHCCRCIVLTITRFFFMHPA